MIRHSIAMVDGQEHYLLPPTIQEVWRVATMDEYGNVLKDAYPRGVFNPCGPGWQIQENVLTVRPFPTSAETFQVWYVPNFDVQMHYGTGFLRGNQFTLSASPTLGLLDRRPNAYAGSILRLLPPSPEAIQEMVIESYDQTTRKATVRLPFEYEADDGSTSSQPSGTVSGGIGSSESSSSSAGGFTDTFLYEIAPRLSSAMWEAIACAAACKLAVVKSVSEKKLMFLEREYKKSMKTIADNLANLQMRTGKAFDKKTVDNPTERFLFG